MIKKNDYMKYLLHTYDPFGWKQLVDSCQSCSVSYPGIPKDFAVVIGTLVGKQGETWFDTAIQSLNGYTPRELLESRSGRIILKMFLHRMPI